jgi:dihydroanticapsin dehydrogenase
MSARLSSKRLIIVGAATGIGRAVAEACVAEGARVVIADLNAEAGHATAADIGCAFLPCNVSDEASVRGMVAQAVAQLGGLDGLVNNAGLQKAGPIETLALSDWEALMAVNVRGVFLATRAAIPHLRAAGGGSIVNTASLAAKRGGPGIAAYAASKGAVLALTTTTALELAADSIRANSVCPGFIDTPFNDPAVAFMGGRAAQAELVRRMVPLGRQALPNEVAPMYVYLLSNESAYVTAQAFSVDGGVYN